MAEGENGAGNEDTFTVELSTVDLVCLGARLFYLLRRGGTLREVLYVIADAGGLDGDDYIGAVWGVLDGRNLTKPPDYE